MLTMTKKTTGERMAVLEQKVTDMKQNNDKDHSELKEDLKEMTKEIKDEIKDFKSIAFKVFAKKETEEDVKAIQEEQKNINWLLAKFTGATAVIVIVINLIF